VGDRRPAIDHRARFESVARIRDGYGTSGFGTLKSSLRESTTMGVLEGRLGQLKRSARFVREDGRSSVLAGVSIGWLLSLGVRMVYPVLLPHLRTAFGMDLVTAGFLITVLWWAYAAGQVPAGVLSDKVGERVVLTASTLMAAVMLLLVIAAPWTVLLFATTALFGLATALFGVARYTAISKVFPERDGIAIGITLAAGNVGNVALPAIAGAIAAAAVWQFGLGVTIPLFFVVAVYLWAVVPGDLAGDEDPGLSMRTARLVGAELRRPAVVMVTGVLILGFSVWQAFTGFYPTYLIENKGLAPSMAAAVFSFYFALGILIQPMAGSIYDDWGIRRTLPAFLSVAAVGLVALPLAEGLLQIVPVTVLLACMMSNIAVTMPYLTRILPEEIQGTGLGILRTAYMLLGATSPFLFGLFADLGYFDQGFWILAGAVLVMILVILRLPEHGQ
jgi:MFS family permease